MDKKKWSRWEIALLFTPLTLLVTPFFARSLKQSDALRPAMELFQQNEKARRRSCQANQRSVFIALLQYTADSDGKFPPATSRQPKVVGWADGLQPWIKCLTCYHCPKDKIIINGNASRAGYTSFWLNANLSGAPKSAVRFPASTFLLGEGSDGIDKTDATYSKSSLPTSWLTDSNSPAFRHLGGANYLFVDGHVAWLKPDEATSCFGRSDCFAVR